MITAVDSSLVLDVVSDSPFAGAAERCLRRAAAEGPLIACECVVAEITPALGAGLEEFLHDWRVQFVPSSRRSAAMAGELFAAACRRGGPRRRVLSDFLVGAHARCHAARLATRDARHFRDYFPELTLLEP